MQSNTFQISWDLIVDLFGGNCSICYIPCHPLHTHIFNYNFCVEEPISSPLGSARHLYLDISSNSLWYFIFKIKELFSLKYLFSLTMSLYYEAINLITCFFMNFCWYYILFLDYLSFVVSFLFLCQSPWLKSSFSLELIILLPTN